MKKSKLAKPADFKPSDSPATRRASLHGVTPSSRLKNSHPFTQNENPPNSARTNQSSKPATLLTSKLASIRDGAQPTAQLTRQIIIELQKKSISQKSVLRALDKRGVLSFFKNLHSDSLYERKMALKFLLELAHCHEESQALLCELSSSFTPLSGLVCLSSMPQYFKENLPSNIAKLKEKLEATSSFVNNILNCSSPSRLGGPTKHSTSKTDDDTFEKPLEQEIPKFWSFPQFVNPSFKPTLSLSESKNQEKDSPLTQVIQEASPDQALDTTFGNKERLRNDMKEEPASGATLDQEKELEFFRQEEKKEIVIDQSHVEFHDDQYIAESTGSAPQKQPRSHNSHRSHQGRKLLGKEVIADEDDFLIHPGLQEQLQAELKNSLLDTMSNERSKNTSFVQSAQDLYVLELTEMDSIPDPMQYLVGFYLISKASCPSPGFKNSPQIRTKKDVYLSSTTRTSINFSSKKQTKPRPSVTRNNYVRGPQGVKSFIEAEISNSGKKINRMERANDMKSQGELSTTSGPSRSARQSSKTTPLAQRTPRNKINLVATESHKKKKTQAQDKSTRRPSVSANSELRKSMVVGGGDGKSSKLETSIHRSELRKSFLGSKLGGHRSVTMTQHDVKRQGQRKLRNLKAGNTREIETSQHNSVKQGDTRKKKDIGLKGESKTTSAKDRKFLLHQSLNDSTQIEQQQTVDLTGLSQFSESYSSYERSGRNQAMETRHSGNHSLFMKTSESKEEERPSRQQSVSLNQQKTSTPRQDDLLEGVRDNTGLVDGSSPKKNFVKMNIERMKKKKAAAQKKLKMAKRNQLKEGHTIVITEREKAGGVSAFGRKTSHKEEDDNSPKFPQRKSSAYDSTGAPASSRGSTLKGAPKAKQEEFTPKSIVTGDRELTPIGEKTGNPTFAVSKPGVSHFTLQRPRGASSKVDQQSATSMLRNPKQVNRTDVMRQSYKFQQKKLSADIKDEKYASNQSASSRKMTITGKLSMLSKPNQTQVSPSISSTKASEQDMLKSVKKASPLGSSEAKVKSLKRPSSTYKPVHFQQARHSIAIAPKDLENDSSENLLSKSRKNSDFSANSNSSGYSMKFEEVKERHRYSFFGGNRFQDVKEINEEVENSRTERGQSSPPTNSKRPKPLDYLEQEEKKNGSGLKLRTPKCFIQGKDRSPFYKTPGSLSCKSEHSSIKFSSGLKMPKQTPTHERKSSSGQLGVVTPRESTIKLNKALKTPTSLSKPKGFKK